MRNPSIDPSLFPNPFDHKAGVTILLQKGDYDNFRQQAEERTTPYAWIRVTDGELMVYGYHCAIDPNSIIETVEPPY